MKRKKEKDKEEKEGMKGKEKEKKKWEEKEEIKKTVKTDHLSGTSDDLWIQRMFLNLN